VTLHKAFSPNVTVLLCNISFVSLSARLRENGWTDLHEIFGEGVECPEDDLLTFLVNFEKPRNVTMRNTETGFVVLSHHSFFLGRPER